jgi:predicted 3-demethylubiquinone-9 3-methyltransferase (glyoxalase superfamily)
MLTIATGEQIMTKRFQRIAPMLWFDDQAEEAAKFYVSIFPNSEIVAVTHYSKEASIAAHRPEGSVLTVAFRLDGQDLTALNGGPQFKFNEAISLVVNCSSQAEIDHFWNKLSTGGDARAQQCGWLKDKFGVAWQVVPTIVPQLLSDSDPKRASRAMSAILKMKKLDIAALEKAAA